MNISTKRSGFTLVELVMVISIIAILAAFTIPSYEFFKRKAQDAVCMSNLRSMHASLSSRLHDHGFVWPQSPYTKDGPEPQTTDDSAEAKWWFEQLKDYGVSRETWLCPAERLGFADDNDPDHFRFSYMPTAFDETPNQAYSWAKQPWVIEIGGFHEGGKGNLVFPDGHLDKGMQMMGAK